MGPCGAVGCGMARGVTLFTDLLYLFRTTSSMFIKFLLVSFPHLGRSTTSSRAQWASPELNCRLPIPAGITRPQPAMSGTQWDCRTSTGDVPIGVGTAGPQPAKSRTQRGPPDPPAKSRSQWARSDLNHQKECQNNIRGRFSE